MKINYSLLIAALVILIGAGIIAIALLSQLRELQIALGLAGASFICTGIVLWGQVADKQQEAEKLQKIMEKLEKIEKELEKEEQSKGTGVAIADVIGAGLKYYTEHMTKPKKEEEND